MRKVHFEHRGHEDYQSCWDYQEEVFARIIRTKMDNRDKHEDQQEIPENRLLFVEHPHVYTLGKSGSEDHLLIGPEERSRLGVTYYKINRGGDITYHGPGQIVGYPLFDLEQFFTDIHRYLRTLEEAIILTLHEYGIKGDRFEGYTGVWLDPDDPAKARKIAAMGVKCSRWVTMHGFAFNVNSDLDFFGRIVPCGIDDKAVTSMQQELGREVDMAEVEQKLLANLANVFDFDLVD